LPCHRNDNGNTIPIMYKREDLRKDQIIVNIIKLMDIILKKEEGLDLHIVSYKVVPTEENSGIIQIVQDSETIYKITEEQEWTLLNYILEHNPELKAVEIRDRFVKSTAAYCVITYLLGIGDRHLDNMMVTKTGYLFHIDFGYILGHDPKLLAPHMRITESMIESIGGKKSKHYQEFKQICTIAYACLRRHANLFLNMLLLLEKPTTEFSRDEIRDQIVLRFQPGQHFSEAKIQLDNHMDSSLGSYTQHIDFMHKQKQRNTLAWGMTMLSCAGSSVVQGMSSTLQKLIFTRGNSASGSSEEQARGDTNK